VTRLIVFPWGGKIAFWRRDSVPYSLIMFDHVLLQSLFAGRRVLFAWDFSSLRCIT